MVPVLGDQCQGGDEICVCVCELPGVAHMCARGQETPEDLEKHLASVDGEAGLFRVWLILHG